MRCICNYKLTFFIG